jgi:RNA polymerase sigma-70 factor (ECF subfamily)
MNDTASREVLPTDIEESVTRTAASEACPEQPSAEHQDGWCLVRAAQSGDVDAFGELYNHYADVVFRYVLYRVADRTVAEDLTSETFLRGLRRISSISYRGRDVGAWFVTIARNLILDHVKSSRYRLELASADPGDQTHSASPVSAGPEAQLLTEATNAELMRCVAELGADQQECVTLRFLQGLSVAETAAAMNRNEGAIKALQHRAVRRLAQLMPQDLR